MPQQQISLTHKHKLGTSVAQSYPILVYVCVLGCFDWSAHGRTALVQI